MTIPAGTLVPRDARDFGSYELIAKLATGGMAEIFLARSHSTTAPGGSKGKVVLKRILPHLAEDEHFVTMFRDEANLASRLIHANVCRVHGLGHHGATWFIVMEYLHGVALSRMLSRLAKKHQFIDFRIIAGIVVQACEGLHHAHELRDSDGHLLNVVHRDVSPPNIMLAADGLVKLLDFGIAKARGANSKTRTGTVKGKNAYMSPEQILGKPLDRRSDVFALGCVMYELLAVKRLFHRDSDFLTFKAITEEPIPDIRDRRPDIPLPLRAALTQALARDPSARFATARAFSEAVKEAVAPLGGPATAIELKKFLHGSFADELTARDDLLKAADDPDAAPATQLAIAGSGGVAGDLAHRATDPPPLGRGKTASEELETVDGELLVTDERRVAFDRPADSSPSMIVAGAAIGPTTATPVRGLPTGGAGSGAIPQAISAHAPTAPISAQAIRGAASGAMPPHGAASGAMPTVPMRSRPRTEPPPLPPPTPSHGTRMPGGPHLASIAMPLAPPRSGTPGLGVPDGLGVTPRGMPVPTAPTLSVVPPPSTSPNASGTQPLPYPLPGGTPVVFPAAATTVGFDDPAFLLKGSRRKSLVRTAIIVGAAAVFALILKLIVSSGGEPDSRAQPLASVAPDAAIVDAAPRPPPVDADNREAITKFARSGYLNLEATAKTTVYIDGRNYGDTPLTLLALPPGVHKIKALGPKGKIKRFDVTIYGGKDTDAPLIDWR